MVTGSFKTVSESGVFPCSNKRLERGLDVLESDERQTEAVQRKHPIHCFVLGTIDLHLFSKQDIRR